MRPTCAISIRSAAEERAALVGVEPIPSFATRDATLHGAFARQVAATPEAIALSIDTASGREERSYAELDERAEALAAHLRALGVGANQVVGLRVERSADVVIGMLGDPQGRRRLPAAGPGLPERADRVHAAGRRGSVVLTPARAGRRALGAARDVCVPRRPLPRAPRRPAAAVARCRDDLAYVIYTSGSTGKPKGVRITHRNVLRLFAATDAWFGFGPSDVWTLFHSYAFDFSVWELWGALLYGGRLVVVPYGCSRARRRSASCWSRERVTVLNQTPSRSAQLIEPTAAAPGRLALRYVDLRRRGAASCRACSRWFDALRRRRTAAGQHVRHHRDDRARDLSADHPGRS